MKQKPHEMTRPFTINELQKIAYKLRNDLMSKEQETAFYDQPDNSDRVEEFDDYLDETTEPLMVAGIKLVPSNALYNADPDAYKRHAEHYLKMVEVSRTLDMPLFLIEYRMNVTDPWEQSKHSFSKLEDAYEHAKKELPKDYQYRIIYVVTERHN